MQTYTQTVVYAVRVVCVSVVIPKTDFCFQYSKMCRRYRLRRIHEGIFIERAWEGKSEHSSLWRLWNLISIRPLNSWPGISRRKKSLNSLQPQRCLIYSVATLKIQSSPALYIFFSPPPQFSLVQFSPLTHLCTSSWVKMFHLKGNITPLITHLMLRRLKSQELYQRLVTVFFPFLSFFSFFFTGLFVSCYLLGFLHPDRLCYYAWVMFSSSWVTLCLLLGLYLI